MNIGELKTLLAAIPPELDHLQVWIDSDNSDGGRPVNDVQLKYAEDCCLDGDECDAELIYEDEVLELLGLESFPEDLSSVEFTEILIEMGLRNYRWEGDSGGEHRFSKQILAIKF